MIDEVVVDSLRQKWVLLKDVLDERGRRLWAAAEVRALGRGGLIAVHRATGLARVTIGNGLKELGDPARAAEMANRRVRRSGAGRKPVKDTDPTLLPDLLALLEPVTRGHPESPLLWTSKSLATLESELRKQGHRVSDTTVRQLLINELGYSLQGNRKTREGKSHPDRDAQFEYINDRVRRAQGRGEPCLSVDTKKKELIGNFKNAGKHWLPRFGAPEVNVYDFITHGEGKAVPYGVYDIGRNEAWVSVGIDHDTAQFSVEAIRRWHGNLGLKSYAEARAITITADCGGSNGHRNRLWKFELQKLADETGRVIHVHHLPPGTSKWNKVEHRLFCQITRNWRGRPLTTLQVIVSLIANTTTRKGLRVHAEADTNAYPAGIKVSDDDMEELNITPHEFHGEWNYTIRPRARRTG